MKTKTILATIAFAATLAWLAEAQIYDTNNVIVQTFAGSGLAGSVDGQGPLTKFVAPSQIVSDSASNIYVWDGAKIRKITADATVSTFAGGGNQLEGYGTNVQFGYFSPFGAMAIDHANTIWIVAGQSGNANFTYLLSVEANSYASIQNGGNGEPGLADFRISSGICFDSANNLYYSGGNRIYRYNPTTGSVQPFAGNGSPGNLDGQGTVFTEFNSPRQLAADSADNIYVWDSGNHLIRRIDQSQNVTTIAGNGSASNQDGQGTGAAFNSVSAMSVDNYGNVFFACGNSIRKMNVQSNVVTIAGSFLQSGYTNGAGNLARFNGANGVCWSQGAIFVADLNNLRIRQISFNPQPLVVTDSNLGIQNYAGITITGLVGRTYQIQSSPDTTNWTLRTTLLLTASPHLWFDQNPVSGNKFYRALLLP